MTPLRYASPHCPLLGYRQHQPSSSSVLRPNLQWMPPRHQTIHLPAKGGADAVALLQAAESSSRAREDGTGELERRIRDQLLDPDAASPAPSPYDTAWVAMVPASSSLSSRPRAPRFPRCLDWILRNQNADGSWRPKLDGAGDPSLIKDALSSTLACVLALTTWGVGDGHAKKGLRFIGQNFSSCLTEDDDHGRGAPAGFNVIFPGMLARGIGMGLEIPLSQPDVDAILRLRDTELKSMMASGSKAFMAYVAEGLGNSDLLDWDEATAAFQRKNGSLFDSPATTAAAAIHNGHN